MIDEADGSVVLVELQFSLFRLKVFCLQLEFVVDRAALLSSNSIISGRWEGDNERLCTMVYRSLGGAIKLM